MTKPSLNLKVYPASSVMNNEPHWVRDPKSPDFPYRKIKILTHTRDACLKSLQFLLNHLTFKAQEEDLTLNRVKVRYWKTSTMELRNLINGIVLILSL